MIHDFAYQIWAIAYDAPSIFFERLRSRPRPLVRRRRLVGGSADTRHRRKFPPYDRSFMGAYTSPFLHANCEASQSQLRRLPVHTYHNHACHRGCPVQRSKSMKDVVVRDRAAHPVKAPVLTVYKRILFTILLDCLLHQRLSVTPTKGQRGTHWWKLPVSHILPRLR